MPTANEIRQQFVDFFCKKHGHTFVPSSSVVPLDDPTLLFTNAGMNQFKPYFLGTEKPPYKRVANTQKCIRAGGKHNDLDDVGKDTYHHTFFEMLGNWSFGDYFKKEAIAWAWELLTDVWKLDKSRLHVTVFEGDPQNNIPRDDEAAGYWRAVGVPDAQIHLGNKKDNFWEMGNTGPCGPCTEVHYDRTADKTGATLVNKGSPEVIEIWNLVFIQFNRNEDQTLTPLPAQHVDTGMGFERITAVLQGKTSNYDTDVFMPIFAAIQKITGAPAYTGKLDDLKDTAYRVIADHIRTLTFALTDGAMLGNDGRNYVLKRILRRAERYGRHYLLAQKPFLCELVSSVVEAMGGFFPELKSNPTKIARAIEDEEIQFIRTLDRGIKLFQRVSQRARTTGANIINGVDAFQLHDTYGIYIDITQQMAQEDGLAVDLTGYADELHRAKQRSRAGQKKHVVTAVQGDLPATDDSAKYSVLSTEYSVLILAWVKDNVVHTEAGALTPGEEAGLVFDETNFYAEQGGQVGDTGWVKTASGQFEVEDTQRLGDAVIHWGKVASGTIRTGETATLEVSPVRFDTMRNHTATHLLNWALREVLGDHVDQKGSLVDAEHTRFDFTHDKPMTHDEIAEVARLVNDKILADEPVTPIVMQLAEAKKIAGVRAVFGEKYPDPVRVVVIGSLPSPSGRGVGGEGGTTRAPSPSAPLPGGEGSSVEFCGGTHLERTSQACLFKIISQEGVAKGVRRITAVTGPKAVEYDRQLGGIIADLTERFHCRPEELPARIESMHDEIKKLQQQLKKGAASDLAGTFDKLLASAAKVGNVAVVIGEIPAGPDDAIRTQVDRVKQKAGSCVVVVGWADDGKAGLLAAVSDDVVKRGVKAGDLIKHIAPIVGGGGGGRPNMAQAGGKDPSKLGDALSHAKRLIESALAK